MEIVDIVKKLVSQYQTRQQLNNLPDHQLKDLALAREDIAIEMEKNAPLRLLSHLLTDLFKRK